MTGLFFFVKEIGDHLGNRLMRLSYMGLNFFKEIAKMALELLRLLLELLLLVLLLLLHLLRSSREALRAPIEVRD